MAESSSPLAGTLNGREPAAPAATAAVPLHLPATPLPLLGRAGDLATAEALLRDPTTRLVTLTGSGGSGKTRLALELGHRLADAFPDGVGFVDLAPVRDPALVLPTIARSLDLQEISGQPLEAAIRARLQGQRLLLILDNCEQVIAAAPALAALVAGTPGLTFLATSRERLHVQVEHEIRVGPLPTPAPDDAVDATALVANPAVALFLQRATMSRHDFRLTAANAAAVAGICRRLDGLPLAIELAAARVHVVSPQAILDRLNRRLPVLADGPRDVPVRQRSLRETIAWSVDLLSPAERALFHGLSIFAGGWSLAAAQAVLGPTTDMDVFAGLASLVDKNLIVSVTGPTVEPRFAMLETIRAFAAEQLHASGAAAALQTAHAQHFLALAEWADAAIETGPDILPSLNEGQEDHDNLRAALATLIERRETEAAQQLAGALGLFWYHRGFWSEGRRWLEQTLALPGAAAPPIAARALCRLGLLASVQADFAGAAAALDASFALAHAGGDAATMANIQLIRGGMAAEQGDFARALVELQPAQAYYDELGDPSWLILIELDLGATLAGLGDAAAAEAHLAKALAAARQVGDAWGEGLVFANLGRLRGEHDQPDAAAPLLSQALTVLRDLGCVYDLRRFLPDVANVALSRGQAEQAARLLGAVAAADEACGRGRNWSRRRCAWSRRRMPFRSRRQLRPRQDTERRASRDQRCPPANGRCCG
jgi:predicted ATPase